MQQKKKKKKKQGKGNHKKTTFLLKESILEIDDVYLSKLISLKKMSQ